MTARPARPGFGVDLALGAGAGIVVVGLLIAAHPYVAIFVAFALVSITLLTRLERVETVASTLVVITAFTTPMNRVPVADGLLVATVGLYVIMRLTEARPAAARTYRPILVGITLLGFGGLIGSFFEVPGPFMYKAQGVDIRDISGFGQNVANLGKFLTGSLMPIALWALARPSRQFARRLLGAFVVGAVISAVVGVLEPVVGGRAVGLTVHPNQLGSLSLLAMGPAMGLMLTTRSGRVRGLTIAAMPVLAMGILSSGSRAALGALVVLGLIIGPLTRSRAVLGAIFSGIAVVLLVFAVGLIRPEGENALGRTLGDSTTAQGSDNIREVLQDEVWHRFTQRPLTGNGYNYMRPSHNVYLGLVASAGVLGVVGLGLVITTVIRRLWRKRTDLLLVGVTAGYLAYLGNAYFDNIFWWRWLWFYVGMVIAVGATRSSSLEARYAAPVDEPASTR